MTERPLHLLHVTETLATGVLDVVARMAAHQVELGHRVTVLHSPRPETPPRAVLQTRLGGAELVTVGDSTQKRFTRLRALRSALVDLRRRGDIDLIHLHSSFAGVVGRLGATKTPVIYSPHGFAFLRRDVSRTKAQAFQLAEAVLARRSDAVLCVSASEEHVARTALRAPTLLVPNRLSMEELQLGAPGSAGAKPLIVNVGRWSPQKAPERFARAATEFQADADFLWIGDGPSPEPLSGYSVSGWIEPTDVVRRLAAASIIYFTSRWEGMPVGLMQAQALGIPAVALSCVGVSDVVVDGVTGLIVDDEATAHRELRRLLDDPARLASMRAAAVSLRDRFSDVNYGHDLMAAYREVVGPRVR
ncbi:glycosyltransferase involved in cell wall biosynthesis [Microbacterium sp. BE35]|uniref:glycosyltransferase n=1 Tax=Microbacterium sp. BE35 TaxID=2817773 RepID=UPI00285E3C73|nr:glycosyltransferase [Microbacterium sp. BE35]MDR7188703.1 glycosyltransferase involved in cell wall biosynthesis [Microbacterium sp. BE35]